jgi:hypothetical protein
METSIVAIDFAPGREDAAARLISHLATLPPYYVATHVVRGSRAEAFLRRYGFLPGAERISMALDLHTWSPRP